jgi:hypothetical protein
LADTVLTLAARVKTVNCINSYITAIAFVYKWFLVEDILQDPYIVYVRKFVGKTCPKVSNKKGCFGAIEIWDQLMDEYNS